MINRNDFISLVSGISHRRESDIEIWQLLAKVLVNQMNMKKLNVYDVMKLTRYFANAKVRSEKLYKYVVRYIQKIDPNKDYLVKTSTDPIIYFYFSLA